MTIADGYYLKQKEINFYMDQLTFLDNISIDHLNPYGNYLNDNLSNDDYSFNDFIVILKSNAFMMLYNMVESTVKELIASIYDQINSSQLSYSNISESLQDLWQKYHFQNLNQSDAKADKYKKAAHDMINSVLTLQPIKLNYGQLKLSGNADFESILTITQQHGINFNTNEVGKYNLELKKIKNTRNSLAHGSSSFIESARDNSVGDIQKISEHTQIYLEQLIKDCGFYIQHHKYKKHK